MELRETTARRRNCRGKGMRNTEIEGKITTEKQFGTSVIPQYIHLRPQITTFGLLDNTSFIRIQNVRFSAANRT